MRIDLWNIVTAINEIGQNLTNLWSPSFFSNLTSIPVLFRPIDCGLGVEYKIRHTHVQYLTGTQHGIAFLVEV